MAVTDYFAELYVAGRFADAGWNVYFPHRDKGFDFIVSKETKAGDYLIRPVQVKGKYPTEGKGSKNVYGYVGRLSTIHPEMVLAIPFFSVIAAGAYLCRIHSTLATSKAFPRIQVSACYLSKRRTFSSERLRQVFR